MEKIIDINVAEAKKLDIMDLDKVSGGTRAEYEEIRDLLATKFQLSDNEALCQSQVVALLECFDINAGWPDDPNDPRPNVYWGKDSTFYSHAEVMDKVKNNIDDVAKYVRIRPI